MSLAWYVAQTKPLAERQACRRLRDQSFPAYVPLLAIRTYVRGEMRERQTPLFPGYLFCRLDTEEGDGWKAATNTQGILLLLPSSERPISVSCDAVEGLVEAERMGLFRRGVVAAGERVRVFRGTLAGQVLDCLAVEGERIRCLWNCLGAPRVVSLRLSNVSVA